jgi:hypothetical protein
VRSYRQAGTEKNRWQERGFALLIIDMLQDYFQCQPQVAAQREGLVARIKE